MTDYDLIIRGGMVVDGRGLPRRRVDVGVRDAKVATLAHLEGATATEEIAEMRSMLAEAMASGAAGISSCAAPTHLDIDGNPVLSVPSFASQEATFGDGTRGPAGMEG